jgi:hypothetical protein
MRLGFVFFDIDMDDMEIETPSKTRGHELIRDPFSATRPRTRSFCRGIAVSLARHFIGDCVDFWT